MGDIYIDGVAAAEQLEARLFEFYAKAKDYFRDAEAPCGNRFHAAIEPLVREIAASRGHISILEPGAGRTTLPEWLKSLRLSVPVVFAAQDVTDVNISHLERCADEVLIGPLSKHDIADRFDLVVSTFVYEHVVNPKEFLDECFRALRPGGAMVIFSPKYTVPLYVPPSIRHLPFVLRQWETLRNAVRAWRTYLSRRPAFRVVARPALFERGFSRDADAVHLVHPLDARLHLRGRATAQTIKVRSLSARDRLWQFAALHGQVFRKIS